MKQLYLLIVIIINVNLLLNHPIHNKKKNGKQIRFKNNLLKQKEKGKNDQQLEKQQKHEQKKVQNYVLDVWSEQNVRRLKAMITEDDKIETIEILQSGSSMCNNIREMFDNSDQLKKLAEGWIQEKTGVLIDLQEVSRELMENEVTGGLFNKAKEMLKKGMNFIANQADHLSDLIQTSLGSIKGYKKLIDLQNLVKNAKDDTAKLLAMKSLEEFQSLFQNKIVQSLFMGNNFFGKIISKTERYQLLLNKIVSNIQDIDKTIKINLDKLLQDYNQFQVEREIAKEKVQSQVQNLFAQLIEKRVNADQFYQIIKDKQFSLDLIQQKFLNGIDQKMIDQITQNSQSLLKITDQTSLEFQQQSQNWLEQINFAKEQMIQNVEQEYVQSIQQNIENVQLQVQQTGKMITEKYEKLIDRSVLDLVKKAENELNELDQQYQNLKNKIFEKAQQIINEDLNNYISKGEQYLTNKLSQYIQKSQQFITQSKEKIKIGFGVDISIESIQNLLKNPMKFTTDLVEKKMQGRVMKSKEWLDKKSQQYGFNDLEEVGQKCQEWVDKKVEQAQKGLSLLNKGNKLMQDANKKVQRLLQSKLVTSSLQLLGPIGIGITAGAELLQTASILSQQVIDQVNKQMEELLIYYHNAKKQLILYKEQLIEKLQTFFNQQLFQILSQEKIEDVLQKVQEIGNNPEQFIISKVCKLIDKQKVEVLQKLTKQINDVQASLISTKQLRLLKSKKRMTKVDQLNVLQQQYDDLSKDIREKVSKDECDERNKELDQAVEQAKSKLLEASKQISSTYTIEDMSTDLIIVIKQEIKDLTNTINDKFDKLEDKQQLISAKQNVQKSMDILLYAIDQVNQIKETCGTQSAGIVILKVDQFQCKIAQRNYLENMRYLSFDYNYKQMLRTYSGEKDIQGKNYYQLLGLIYNTEELKRQYQIIQDVIKQSTLAYLVYNQINNKFQANSIQIEENSLQRQVENMDTILQITNCRNCLTLDEDIQLRIYIGESIYCESTQADECQNNQIERAQKQLTLSKDKQQLIEDSKYDLKIQLTKSFTEFNSKYVKPKQTDLDNLMNDINQNLPNSYKKTLRVHVINLNFDQQVSDNNFIFYNQNTDKLENYLQLQNGVVKNFFQDYKIQTNYRIFVIQEFYVSYLYQSSTLQQKKTRNYKLYLSQVIEKYLNIYQINANSIMTQQQYCKDFKDTIDSLNDEILVCNFNLYNDLNSQFNYKSLLIKGENPQIMEGDTKIQYIVALMIRQYLSVKFTINSYLGYYQIIIIFENVGKMEILFFVTK